MTITEAAKRASQCGGAIMREKWDDMGVRCHIVLSNLDQRMIIIKDTGDIVAKWSPQLDDICANDWLVTCQMIDSPYPHYRLSKSNSSSSADDFNEESRNCGQ